MQTLAQSAWLQSIADHPGDDAARFRWALITARIPTGDAARLLGRDRRMVARWISGAKTIPPDIWLQIAKIAANDK